MSQHTPRAKDTRNILDYWIQNSLLEKRESSLLYRILNGIEINVRHIYELFAGEQPEELHGGGGIGGRIDDRPHPLRTLTRMVFDASEARLPALGMRVRSDVWDRSNPYRWYTSDPFGAVALYMQGTVTVESMSTRTRIRKLAHLNLTSGTGFMPARALVGANVNFHRFGTDRGKLVVRTYVFEDNSISDANEREVDGTESAYFSEETILSTAFQADHDPGGAGLKVHLDLEWFGQ